MNEPAHRSESADDPPVAPLIDATLTRLVSVDTLQMLQDRFTALGKVTVCICTVSGELITKPTWGSPYSKLIGTSRRGQTAFAVSIRACLQDPKPSVPMTCHEGMSLYATPISYGGQRLAVIVVGTRTPAPPPADTVRRVAAMYEVDPDALVQASQLIDRHSGGAPESIHRFADVLADTIATLYSQALHIERQLADLRVVHGLAELLAGTRDLHEILDATVKRVVEVMDVKACAIRLLNEETGELVIKAVHNLSDQYLQKGPVMLRDSAIDRQAFTGKTVYIEDAPHDPRIRYPQNARREGIVSGLSLPMTYRGQTVGLLRVYTGKRRLFSKSEESLLRSIGSHAAAVIINSRLYEENLTAERFQRQVETAGEIQRRMLPPELPRHPYLEFGCIYEPTLQVGGDFYDFIDLPEGNLGVCIADVVGKGLPAALMMASVRSALRAYATHANDLETIFEKVNRHMYRDTLDSEFATMVYAVFSPDGRTMTYCNAGHTPPLLLRGEKFTQLTKGGPVIGVLPDAAFEPDVLRIHEGDIIVMTTDGVIEAIDFQDRAYGQERLLSSIWRYRSLDAEQLARQILWDVRRFVGLADQSDDISVVVVKAP